ncbi:MAG: molybdopterin-guanine dinucleotide biosynthesis protein [Deltaproteobacteria bacterium]|nr:molybdopterin-guanine dinucleotide biosynthesis protein [Deltaproteobacteria bacterium]
MTGVILAGGESTRMGKNKAFIEINGQRIIDRTVFLFREIFDDVLLVTNTPLDYLELNVKIVTDLVPGKGSLGGVYTGLFFSSSPKAFFVGCDMPFLDRRVIHYFLSLAPTADIVVQRTKDYWEPLHAIYPRTLLKPIERLFQQGELTIFKAYQGMKVREVSEEELKPYDPDLHTLSNFNTPEELKNLLETCPNAPL